MISRTVSPQRPSDMQWIAHSRRTISQLGVKSAASILPCRVLRRTPVASRFRSSCPPARGFQALLMTWAAAPETATRGTPISLLTRRPGMSHEIQHEVSTCPGVATTNVLRIGAGNASTTTQQRSIPPNERRRSLYGQLAEQVSAWIPLDLRRRGRAPKLLDLHLCSGREDIGVLDTEEVVLSLLGIRLPSVLACDNQRHQRIPRAC